MDKSADRLPRHISIGLLAHVDAGKTTLAEGILYLNGRLRRLGRVDHRDAFLDTYEQERARGITIFSKQALVTLGTLHITLLDTPGHVDFSAEMERTLQVLDMAILVINGADGVQSHVETLWRLLGRYRVPVFLFVNKMDQAGTDKERLLKELQARLDMRCVDFDERQDREAFLENIALCEEGLMEEYLDTGNIGQERIRQKIGAREIFPCYFGSALKLFGVEELLEGIQKYMPALMRKNGAGGTPDDEAAKAGSACSFGARVYKISRDRMGTRLTHIKITEGRLRIKSLINEEKVDQIRIYDGAGYQLTEEAEEGCICALTGLNATYSGQGLGTEKEGMLPVLEPVLTYRIELSPYCDRVKLLGQLRQLEEEIPELHIVFKESSGEIHVQVMGEVQTEVIKGLIQERFGTEVGFGEGSIVYKETIAAPVEGIGHFEPLRHYAEVHLLLEPGEAGSGLQFASACSEDVLDRNWQRLIIGHLEERQHMGVLTGSEITDMRITLVAGRAHIRHTEGGDFRQATYRALRQGLRKAPCVLLEPVYEFTLTVPAEMLGRAMSDIRKMHGTFDQPGQAEEMALLKGKAPVVTIRGYQTEVAAYTHGRGRLVCRLSGYEPCHNAEEVIERIGYDPEADPDNPTGSVFCAHGAGFIVSWDQVDSYAHVESVWRADGEKQGEYAKPALPAGGRTRDTSYIDEEELEKIFERTYGPIKRDRNRPGCSLKPERTDRRPEEERENSKERSKAGWEEQRMSRSINQVPREEYLLVDGYNIIFAWEELRRLSEVSIDGARGRLCDLLCNYQGFCQNTVIVVFDAYKVKGNPGSVEKYHNIYVVYTKEAETADQYIEKTVHKIGRKYQVTVATSDALEQMIIWGEGAFRLSAQGLWDELEKVNERIREAAQEKLPVPGYYPFRRKEE